MGQCFAWQVLPCRLICRAIFFLHELTDKIEMPVYENECHKLVKYLSEKSENT